MDKAASALLDGVGFVKHAVELDKNKEIEEAVKFYDLAVYFLKIACNGKQENNFLVFSISIFRIFTTINLTLPEKDQSDPSLDALRKKIIEYSSRSKTLKKQVAPAQTKSDKAAKEKEIVQLT